MRRGHARGGVPTSSRYGVVLTLGAFQYLQWLSAVSRCWSSGCRYGPLRYQIAVGVTLTATGLPGRLVDRVRDWRQ